MVVAELEILAGKKADLQNRLEEANARIADQQAKLEEKKRESAALGKQIAQLGEQLGAAKEHRSGLLSRQKLLKDLEARREGVSEGVKSVLKQREAKFPFIRGLVADILQVDVEHAHAIEAALDGRDQWLVTNDQALAVAAEDALNDLEGRVNVVCVDRLHRDTGLRPVPSTSEVAEPQSADSSNNTHGPEARVTGGADQLQRDTGLRPVPATWEIVEPQSADSSNNAHGPEARVTGGADQLQRDTGLRPVPATSQVAEPQTADSLGHPHGPEARVTAGADQLQRDTGLRPVPSTSEVAEPQTADSLGHPHGPEARVTAGTDQLQRDTGLRPVPATSQVAESQSADSLDHPHGPEARVTGEFYDWNRHSHLIRLAADLVKVEPKDRVLAEHLLGKTIVVDHLKIAVDLHRTGPRGYRYVTLIGDVLEADGTLRSGPLTAAMGLLSRKSELNAVNLQIAEVDLRITALTQEFTQGNASAKEMDEQQNVLRNGGYQANTAKVEVTSAIAQNNDRQNSLNREQPVLDRELNAFTDQLNRLTVEEEKVVAQKTVHETDQTARQKSIEESTAKHAQLAEELRESSEALTRARVQLGQVQEQQLACQQHVQRQTVGRAELVQQIERITQANAAVAGKRGGAEHDLATAKHAESVASEKRDELSNQIQTLKTQVTEAGEAVKALSTQVELFRRNHSAAEQELHALQLEAGQVKIRLETLVSRTIEEFQLDLPGKYGSLEGGYQPSDQDWPAVAGEIKELRDKIQRLGNVNVDAISEMTELETRQTFLATQLTDLASSKKQLEELIETINIESSARFEQTFNTVREHFQGMFRKLFGGGKADVYLETELTDEKTADGIGGPAAEGAPQKKKFDLLDAGIEIIARPPGKQPATISQLSGGEKTMTCIALLMSIFKSKPSPFCILDEVDAALDEANNQRFNLIIQEFLEQSQFIVITHSKRTMQIADVLYGVTMQEQGVSKRVSVKFEQVDHQGRIAESAAA